MKKTKHEINQNFLKRNPYYKRKWYIAKKSESLRDVSIPIFEILRRDEENRIKEEVSEHRVGYAWDEVSQLL